MDSTLTAAEVADRIGVPVTTVLRWCRQGRIAAHKDERGRWQIDPPALRALVRGVGAVPVPHPSGRSRTDLLVLAALVRAPRGLPSARAVAATAGLAPTTASRTLGDLQRVDLAQMRDEPRILEGRSRTIAVWYANLDHPEMAALLPHLHRVVLPDPPPGVLGRLPDHLWHLFWNADPGQVDPRRDAALVAHRAMTAGDPEALAWAIRNLPVEAFHEALGYRGVAPDNVAWARAAETLRGLDAAA